MKKLLLNTAMAAAKSGHLPDAHVVRKICTVSTDKDGNPLDTSVTRYTTGNTGRLTSISFDYVSSPGIKAGTLLSGYTRNKRAIKQKKMLKVKVFPKDKLIISSKRKLLIKLLRSA